MMQIGIEFMKHDRDYTKVRSIDKRASRASPLLVYESHFSDVWNESESAGGGYSESSGPIDAEGSAEEVVAGYDSLSVGFFVSLAWAGPEAGVLAFGAVVAEDEEFVVVEGDGVSLSAEAGAVLAGLGVVDVAEELYISQAEGSAGSGEGD